MFIISGVEQNKTLNGISCLYNKYLKSNIKQHKTLKESEDSNDIFSKLFYVDGDNLFKNVLIEGSEQFSYKYNFIKSDVTKTVKIEENVKMSLDKSIKCNNITQGVNICEGLTRTTLEYNFFSINFLRLKDNF